MIPQNPLQQLRYLDKTSPQFHEHLSNFFRGNVYQDILPGIQNEGLAWLVEYLDSVRPQITLLNAVLNADAGSRRCFRSRGACFQGIAERTQKDMRRQTSATEIVHAFRVTPGMCVRGNIQRFKGSRQAREAVSWRRPTEAQGSVYLMIHSPYPRKLTNSIGLPSGSCDFKALGTFKHCPNFGFNR